MRKKSETGKIGEEIAVWHLKKNGCRIIDRNFWKPWGEIDIIARDKGVLVFVEVKAMSGVSDQFKPEDHYNQEKGRRVKRTAQLFAGHYPQLVSPKLGWRVDLIAITITNPLLTDYNKDCIINHYENVE